MVNRTVVGAHYGLKDWLIQRVTAVLIVVYTFIVAGLLFTRLPLDYDGWRSLFVPQWFRIITLMFLLAVFWHAWIGMRDILMDYIKPTGIRLGLQVLVVLALVAYSFWSMMILWSL
ncbi:MAG: succinate dehydrogenase, hydrophobic membrane anchor protein [Pseudomonadota bacterium]